MSNINIFGTKFAYPRGLRKSPGANKHAACVGRKMTGSSGKRHEIKAKFAAATRECMAEKAEVVESVEAPIETEPVIELESESQPASEATPAE